MQEGFIKGNETAAALQLKAHCQALMKKNNVSSLCLLCLIELEDLCIEGSYLYMTPPLPTPHHPAPPPPAHPKPQLYLSLALGFA